MAIVWLPWAVIAIGVASLFVRTRSDSESTSRANPVSLLIAVVLVLAGLFALSKMSSQGGDLMPTLYGVAIGGVVGLLLATALEKFIASAVSAAGFALGGLVVAASGVALSKVMTPEQMPDVFFGAGLGLAIAAWATAGSASSSALGGASLGAIVIATVDELGRRGPGNHAGEAGLALGLVIAVCATLALGVLGADEKKRRFVPLAMTALMVGAGWLVSTRLLGLSSTWIIFGSGVGAACVVHYLLPEDDDSSFGFMLATLIWLGLATLSFGMDKGFGMSVATLGAAGLCLAMRNGRALLSMGPLFGLILYRIFRELFTDSSRALDIGQHYGLIGIFVGATLPVLAWEWWRTSQKREGLGRSISAGLWGLVLLGAPLLIAMLLSSKGYVGWVAGLGVSGMILGLRGEKSSTPIVFASGIAAFSAVGFVALQDYIDLTREEKVGTLAWSIGIFVVVALLIWFLSVRSNDAAIKEGQ